MSNSKIVIVTQELDPHVDEVIVAMRARGLSPVRLHLNEIMKDDGLSIEVYRDMLKGHVNTGVHGRLQLGDIKSIWWRRPTPCRPNSNIALNEREQAFAQREVIEAVSGLWSALPCYWMSKPEYLSRASWKVEQLQRAARFGFDIPKTLVTIDKKRVLEFFDECGENMIYKVLSTPDLGLRTVMNRNTVLGKVSPEESFTTKTTLLKKSDLHAHADAVAIAPCLFQEYIPKRIELRVTLFEDKIFTAEIHSQEQEETKIDWRNYEVPMKLAPGRLPKNIEAQCYKLMKSYGLTYSAIDMIVTPDDRYIFVENNPNGQWLFVEKRLPEMRMTDALIECLNTGVSGNLN